MHKMLDVEIHTVGMVKLDRAVKQWNFFLITQYPLPFKALDHKRTCHTA